MNSKRWKIAQAAEIRWWQRYLRNRSPEEYLTWKKAYWNSFLKKLDITLADKQQILDAGCGPAGIFTILDQHEVDAMDPLLETYERKLAHFSKDQYPAVGFQQLQLEELEKKEAYDWIFCLNAINHVDHWEKSIGRLRAALKPGGTLVLSTDIHRWSVLKFIFKLIPGDVLHPQQHDRTDYLWQFPENQWQVKKELEWSRNLIFSYQIFVMYKSN